MFLRPLSSLLQRRTYPAYDSPIGLYATLGPAADHLPCFAIREGGEGKGPKTWCGRDPICPRMRCIGSLAGWSVAKSGMPMWLAAPWTWARYSWPVPSKKWAGCSGVVLVFPVPCCAIALGCFQYSCRSRASSEWPGSLRLSRPTKQFWSAHRRLPSSAEPQPPPVTRVRMCLAASCESAGV